MKYRTQLARFDRSMITEDELVNAFKIFDKDTLDFFMRFREGCRQTSVRTRAEPLMPSSCRMCLSNLASRPSCFILRGLSGIVMSSSAGQSIAATHSASCSLIRVNEECSLPQLGSLTFEAVLLLSLHWPCMYWLTKFMHNST